MFEFVLLRTTNKRDWIACGNLLKIAMSRIVLFDLFS